ncbi:alpha-galactosidase 2 [Apiospora hydei]|uniref:Alpha-galactosidase n=1 Tax=Apiospora hydei TaxID=1337664 RepID=A0ABR1UTW1_9PEZI
MTSRLPSNKGLVSGLIALASLLATPTVAQDASTGGVVVNGTNFALNGDHVSYRFHVDEETGDLINDHFGGLVTETVPMLTPKSQGWVEGIGRVKREFPDLGRGDFRVPAVRIQQTAGYTVSDFRYRSHDVVKGKPALPGLPSTFGREEGDVTTLVVHMYDNYSSVAADLTYSVFPKLDAIVRSVNITNEGKGNITIERLASFSVDLPYGDYDMIELKGDWGREGMKVRRKVDYGTQGLGGEAWGFSLIYTGSFAVDVEKGSQGFTRAMLGLNPYHLSWNLGPGESLTSPECVATYSENGIGGVSRLFHRLFRNHLMKSKFAVEPRPVLLNSWEGLFFDYNESRIYNLAQESAELGVKLFVLDDGWFGNEYPRVTDNAGLGDWQANKDRFPNGLDPLVDQVTALTAANSSDKLQFGLWFEPEMVNPNSTLYKTHPDWALHAGDYPRTLTRAELVLNVALPEVQDFIIASLSDILGNTSVSYVKWDNNRAIHEMPRDGVAHAYMLGLYRVFETLMTRFPDVLFEGCASGGGRFDPGILQYFPQVWTSDDTDALQRIYTQFGTSLVYPPSSMGAHVSVVPNQQTGRTIPLQFRAHVALMGGSFGFELDPAELSDADRAQIPGIISLAEEINPIIVKGDLWRLNLPEDSNWPAALYLSEDGSKGVLFYFQVRSTVDQPTPYLRLQGLDPAARYTVNGTDTYSGATLMRMGLQYRFNGEYDSKVVLIEKA